MTNTTHPSTRKRFGLFRKHDEEGQAAIEFLLALPFFIVFFLLAVDFAVLGYHYISVSNSVREGARFASVNCGDGNCDANDVRDRAASRSGGILDATEVEVDWIDVTGDGNEAGRGDAVAVRATHTYNFLFVPGASIDVTSCADMRLEQRDGTAASTGEGEC